MVGTYQPEKKRPFFCLVICIRLGVGNKTAGSQVDKSSILGAPYQVGFTK